MTKRCKCGLYLGRFQPLHMGHASIINKMLDECDEVIIAVGSAQESGTERNPLSFDFRKRLIEEAFKHHLDRITILPINDRETYADDSFWGDYLFGQIYEQTSLRPNAIYEGAEATNAHWYDNYHYINVIRVNRGKIIISGTQLREAFLHDEIDFVRDYLPLPIIKYYNEIRKEIQNGKTNRKRDSVD